MVPHPAALALPAALTPNAQTGANSSRVAALLGLQTGAAGLGKLQFLALGKGQPHRQKQLPMAARQLALRILLQGLQGGDFLGAERCLWTAVHRHLRC